MKFVSTTIKLGGVLAIMTATSAMAPPQSAPQAKTCLFYEDFNYGGAHFALYAGDMLTTSAQVNPKSVYESGVKGKTFVDAKRSNISSLKVPKNCMAIVYNGKDKAVGLWSDLPQFSPQYNDKSVGFGCHCK